MASNTTNYVLSVLYENSSPENPLTVSKITELIHAFPLPDTDKPSRDAVSDALKAMTDPSYTHYWNPLDFGFNINVYTNHKGHFKRLEPDNYSSTATQTKYYAYSGKLEIHEIKLLMDALESYSYLSKESSIDLISRIADLSRNSLSKTLNRDYDPQARIPDIDSYLISNLGDLRELINSRRFVKIQNSYYGKDHTLKTCKPAKVKLILPVRVVFANGFYYLVAREYSTRAEKYVTTHYRVDRLDIIDLQDGEQPDPEAFKEYMEGYRNEGLSDSAAYRLRHPIMFGGQQINAQFLMRNTEYMLNTLQDFFGGMSTIKDAPDEMICRYIPDESEKTLLMSTLDENAPSPSWLLVSVKASFGGLRLFFLEYCENVRVISPDDLEENIRKTLKDSLQLYGDD